MSNPFLIERLSLAISLRDMSVIPQRRSAPATRRRALGGVAGNELLTAAVAGVLAVLLLAEALTLLDLRGLRTPHMLLGLVLIPPVLLKLASTGHRMLSYYRGVRAYREKGPPVLPLRLLAPILVAATIAIFASGVAMLLVGHRSDTLMFFHQGGFIVWSGLFAVHFLSYAPRMLRSLAADWRASRVRGVPGAGLRGLLVASSLGAGVALALVLLPHVTAWHPGG
jgi:hypothetical protein